MLLILLNTNIKLPLSELNNSGLSAPSMRLFCFKEENNSPKILLFVRIVDAAVVALTNLGLFYSRQKTTELAMCTPANCNNCPLTEKPIDHLQAKLSMLDFAIEGATNLLSDQQSGYPQTYASGLKQIWYEADEAIKRYVKSKGDIDGLV